MMTDNYKLFSDEPADAERDARGVTIEQARTADAWARAIAAISPFLADVVWRLAVEHAANGCTDEVPHVVCNAGGALCDAFERLGGPEASAYRNRRKAEENDDDDGGDHEQR